jgi:hypothetical protein
MDNNGLSMFMGSVYLVNRDYDILLLFARMVANTQIDTLLNSMILLVHPRLTVQTPANNYQPALQSV